MRNPETPMGGKALEDALKELQEFGIMDEELENVRDLEVGESTSGDLPGGGSYTVDRLAPESYMVKTDKDEEKEETEPLDEAA